MQFQLLDTAVLVPNQFYFTANALDVDRNGNLRKNKQPSGPYKFLRIRDENAEIRARGNVPLNDLPPTAVFEYTDENGQVGTFELSYNQLNYVSIEPLRPSERSGVSQFGYSFGGRRRRKTTSSSRARRRSRTRKSRRATGGGR